MTATKRQRCVILLAAFASTAVIVASAYSYSKIGFSGILPMIDDKVNPSDGTKYNSTNNETKQRGNIKSSAPRNETEVARETPENKRKEWLPVQHKNPSFPSDIYCAAPAVPVGDIALAVDNGIRLCTYFLTRLDWVIEYLCLHTLWNWRGIFVPHCTCLDLLSCWTIATTVESHWMIP